MSEAGGDSEERWPTAPTRFGLATRPVTIRAPKPGKLSRRPAPGLLALVVFGLLATMLAAVSAEPLWLALGHGVRGTATVTRCSGQGLTRHCRATFTVPGDPGPASLVTVIGANASQRHDGARLAARVVAPGRGRAYAGGTDSRALVGLLLLLGCGLLIAWSTGAYRLPERGTRRYALGASLAGPLLLLAGGLTVTW